MKISTCLAATILVSLTLVIQHARGANLLVGDVQKEVIKRELSEVDALKKAQLHPGSLRSIDLLTSNYFKVSISFGLRQVTQDTRPKWYMAHARMENSIRDESYIDYVLSFGMISSLMKFLTRDDPDYAYLEVETKLREQSNKQPVTSGFFDRYFDAKTGRDKKEDVSFNLVDQETRTRVDGLFDRYLIYPCRAFTDLMQQKKSMLTKYDNEIEKWNDYQDDEDNSKRQLVHDFLLNRLAVPICKHITNNRDKYRKCVTSASC